MSWVLNNPWIYKILSEAPIVSPSGSRSEGMCYLIAFCADE